MKKQLKKSRVVFLTIVMAFSILQAVCAFAADASPALKIEPQLDAKAGDNIVIPVEINGNPGFSSFNMEVTLPKGWTMSCDKGHILLGSFVCNPGKGLLGYMHQENTKGDGELFQLHVKVPASAVTGTYKITINVKEMTSDIKSGSEEFSDKFRDVSCEVRVDGKTDVSSKIEFVPSDRRYTYDSSGVDLNGLTTEAKYTGIEPNGTPRVTYRLDNQYGLLREFSDWNMLEMFLSTRQPLDAGTYKMFAIYEDNTQWGRTSFEFVIEKAEAVNCKADSFTRLVRYDNTVEQVFSDGDIKAAFRAANPDKTIGSVVTIDKAEITSDPNSILAAPKVENNSVSYHLKSGLTTDSVGKTAEITITFSSANYEPSTMTFTVTVTDKVEHNITVESSRNGQLHVTPPDKAAEGTTVTIDAIPRDGYTLKELTIEYDNKTIHLVRDEDSGEFIIQP